jgi:hypothetical protein
MLALLSPNRSIQLVKNPGRTVRRAKPKTCLKMGMSRAMKMSVKAMNASVNAHILFEPKGAMFALFRSLSGIFTP